MSDPRRAFVVDDEPLAVRRLVRMLEATGKVEVVGSATDPERALASLADPALAVDVVFLDIQMPGMTGLDLARRLPPGPVIVFVTAYDEFALRAFEVSAVDYLVKPVRAADLDRALAKLGRLGGRPAGDRAADLLARLESALATPPATERIASRLGDRIHFLDPARVTHFVAEDKLTCAVTAERSYVVDVSISDLEARLAPARFFRIHRATLVNLAFVGELEGAGAGAVLRLTDAARTELSVARDRVRALKERLGT
jgi:two-component system, LytTR family, response regulator